MLFTSPSETGWVNPLLRASQYPAIVGSLNLDNAENNMNDIWFQVIFWKTGVNGFALIFNLEVGEIVKIHSVTLSDVFQILVSLLLRFWLYHIIDFKMNLCLR